MILQKEGLFIEKANKEGRNEGISFSKEKMYKMQDSKKKRGSKSNM